MAAALAQQQQQEHHDAPVHSELSYSDLSTSSSSFGEILDDTSSNGSDDEVIFSLNGSSSDGEEDFVLIPYHHPHHHQQYHHADRRSSLEDTPSEDAHSDGDDDSVCATTHSLDGEGRSVGNHDGPARTTPEPLSQPVTPITPTTPLKPCGGRGRDGRGGRGGRSQGHGQQQQQPPQPFSPSACSAVSKANWATQDRRRRRKAAAARRLAAAAKNQKQVKATENKPAEKASVAERRGNSVEKKLLPQAPAQAQLPAQTQSQTRGRPPRGSRRRGRKLTPAESYPSPDTSPERDSGLDLGLLTERELFVHPGTMITMDSVVGRRRQLVVESDAESEYAMMRYEDAKSFITSFLLNPSTYTYTRLTFLQSLIIELGLLSPTSELPASLSAATRVIKSRAFVNIGDYLLAREKGPQELERIKFKSRRALTYDLKKGGSSKAGANGGGGSHRKVEKGWVKRHGLDVLLVSVFGR